jgi:hypothetical protein
MWDVGLVGPDVVKDSLAAIPGESIQDTNNALN